jgi:hypothetical protein
VADHPGVNIYSDAWHWYWDTAGTVWGWVAELVAAYPGVALSALIVAAAVAACQPRVEWDDVW